MNVLGRLSGRDRHTLAAPYVLDALDADERERFERHLSTCAKCAAEVRELAGGVVRLAASAAAPAPAAMRERVLAAVRATPQEPPPAPAVRPAPDPGGTSGARTPGSRTPVRGGRAPRPRPLLVPAALATAVVALVAAALFAVQATRTDDRLDQARDRAAAISQVLAAPDARAANGRDSAGRGIAVIASATQGRAVVTVTGLGAPPSGKVRQLWLMRPDAPPRSLGLLNGDTPVVATGLSAAATDLAVTTEPGGGSPRPTTAVLVQLPLEAVGFGQ